MQDTHVVDVWWYRWRPVHAGLPTMLDDAERQRAARYHRSEDTSRFTAAAALVRVVAGRRLGVSPDRVTVDRACSRCARPHGRVRVPALPGTNFSVTHSAELVGVALCPHSGVGLDLERTGTQPAVLDDLRPMLTAGEKSWLDGVPPTDRGRAVLRLWTRKEAVLKATGDGLTAAVTDLDVAVPEMARLNSWVGRGRLVGVIAMADVVAGDGYIASVATLTGSPIRVVVHDANALPEMTGP